MNTANMPAMPTDDIDLDASLPLSEYKGGRLVKSNGLTKLEHFAGLAMQGIVSGSYGDYDGQNWADNIADESINIAKALLKQLEGESNE